MNRFLKNFLAIAAMAALSGPAQAAARGDGVLKVHPAEVVIPAGRTQQLVVSVVREKPVDRTREAVYKIRDPGILSINSDGLLRAAREGKTRVTIRVGDAHLAIPVTVLPAVGRRSFRRDVMPVLSSKGCNLGTCHGKATGQRGFKLSLFGSDPEADFRALTQESRGRRLFPAAPEQSLMLLKATGQQAHGGGRRFERDSDAFQAIVAWVSEGVEPPRDTDPRVMEIDVHPAEAILEPGGTQQIAISSLDSKGLRHDVTRDVVYEVDKPEIATVDSSGRIRVTGKGGLFAVLVRYGPLTATFRGTVPYVRDDVGQNELSVVYDALEEQFAGSPIDRMMLRQWRRLAVAPSPVASDESFIRRSTLDICGTLPTPSEIRNYRDDKSPQKRRELVNKLLERPEYANYFAVKWADILQNRGRGYSTSKQRPGTSLFYGWIRDSIALNKPYDQFAGEIIAASGSQEENPPAIWYRSVRTLPNYVESVAQAFLGVRIQCAQCHHHPFDRWTQADYFGLAAVFVRVGRKGGFADAEVPTSEVIYLKDDGQVLHPKTSLALLPRPLGGPDFQLGPFDDPRHALASWFSSPDNPYFAAAFVNRTWAHFLGHGLVDPIDDSRSTNPASNPELLDHLSRRFIQNGFNIKDLVREICLTHAYQLQSQPTPWNAEDDSTFARFYPRRLSAEVLLDGISQVLGVPTVFPGGPGKFPQGTRAIELPDENVAVHFLDVFGRPGRNKACECERVSEATLGQALALVNSAEIQGKLTADDGFVATLVASDATHEENVTEVFLRILARNPTDAENAVAVEFLANENNKNAAYQSFIWSLLVTNEFLFTH
jgi:hypothetical protein